MAEVKPDVVNNAVDDDEVEEKIHKFSIKLDSPSDINVNVEEIKKFLQSHPFCCLDTGGIWIIRGVFVFVEKIEITRIDDGCTPFSKIDIEVKFRRVRMSARTWHCSSSSSPSAPSSTSYSTSSSASSAASRSSTTTSDTSTHTSAPAPSTLHLIFVVLAHYLLINDL